MSDLFDDDPRKPAPPAPPPESSSRSRALIITAGVLLAGFVVLTVFAGFWTERLWFGSKGFQSVFTTLLWTRVGLFLVFGSLMALAVGASVAVAYRTRPLFRPTTPEQTGLDRYRDVVLPVRTWLMVGIALVVGGFAGASAAGQWRTYMLWRNGESFGSKDPYFGRDLGFFIFDLPWLHFVTDFVMAAAIIALIAAATVQYLFGGIKLQVPRDRVSGAAMAQFSVIFGVFVLAKAVDYWLERFDLVTESGSLITGMNYTDQNAVLPGQNILAGIAVLVALLFFFNVWRRAWAVSAMGLAMLVVSSILVGVLWPGVVQQFSVDPTEADKEAPYIAANIKATRAAFGLDDVEEVKYSSPPDLSVDRMDALKSQLASMPIVDPSLSIASFELEQQVRAYYSVAPVLDVDRYNIDGEDRALVLGVRELDQDGLDPNSRNWSNLHTVYTHGNGVIAAYANQRAADDVSRPLIDVQWAEGRRDDERELTDLSEGGYEGRVYYGELSPDYSVVGKASPSATDVELDLPPGTLAEGEEQTTTYDGAGGVEMGSLFRKVLYAVKFGEPNMVLSERVNENSKILYDRQPGMMLEKVAPWLTVDSDPFPAVVDGRTVWIMDGYTTTDQYPQSQVASFETMTKDSLAVATGFQTLPTDQINYMRNAVKATVDAYDGTITLYAWDESDPILKAWRSAFPGVVKDRADIPETLLEHLRYPEDLFKAQRYQFARYHVTEANDFYENNSRWEVPADPANPSQTQPPYRLFVNSPTAEEATEGVDNSDVPTTEDQTYSMTSVFVPRQKSSLAAFMSVDSDASDPENYGKLRVLELANEDNNGPRLAANQISSDTEVRAEIFKFTQGDDIIATYGNLLTVPVGDGLMYVQPWYAARDANSPRNLQFVLVAYGDEVGIGKTLEEAIVDVLVVDASDVVDETVPVDPNDPGTPETDPTPDPDPSGDLAGTLPKEVQRQLDLANKAYAEADRLQAEGDTAGWADKLDEARGYVDRAVELLTKKNNG